MNDVRYAYAALTYLVEPGDIALAAMLRAYGPVTTLAAIRAGRLPKLQVTDQEATVGRWRARLKELPDPSVLDRLSRTGIRFACPADAEWPSQLADLRDKQPYGLWLRGSADLRFCALRSVAVVGSRAASAYGSYVASEFSGGLAARGWTVVSGCAYGVDAAAHRAALGIDGLTIAVLACGVDRAYPAGHAGLLDAIAAQGVVVSEWPPGRRPARTRFLVRNRVIAAITAGTLVVEAGARSGALNTGRHARDLRRRLMAVPGPITSDLSAGCHEMIRNWDATCVTSAADCLECLSPVGTAGDPAARDAVLPLDELDLECAAVLDALPTRTGKGPAEVARDAGMTMPDVLRCLSVLSAGGFVERAAGGWRVRKAALGAH